MNKKQQAIEEALERVRERLNTQEESARLARLRQLGVIVTRTETKTPTLRVGATRQTSSTQRRTP